MRAVCLFFFSSGLPFGKHDVIPDFKWHYYFTQCRANDGFKFV